MKGTQMPDASVAALAFEHGLTLGTTDGDFARLPAAALAEPAGHLSSGVAGQAGQGRGGQASSAEL
jgi:hypothetical protein